MDAENQVLVSELRRIHVEVRLSARQGEWGRLNGALRWLVHWGEAGGGCPQIATRARAVHELIGREGAGRDQSGARVERLVEDLSFDLSEALWRAHSTERN